MSRLEEDAGLRRAFAHGDQGAMAAVYQEYGRPLYGLLAGGFSFQSRGKSLFFKGFTNGYEIENCVQEVFVRAFAPAARQAYDGVRPYRNYLFSIARNLVIDSYRKKTRKFVPIEEITEADAAAAEEPNAERQPELRAEQTELCRRVQDFIASLSAAERGSFVVRFEQGASVEKSAATCKVSEHRIKKTEKIIKKRFFKFMKAGGYFTDYRYGKAGLEQLMLMLLLSRGSA